MSVRIIEMIGVTPPSSNASLHVIEGGLSPAFDRAEALGLDCVRGTLILAEGFGAGSEAEGEAADDGHILGAMSGSITRQVVLELDIEQPMHALDAPVAARAPGNGGLGNTA